MLSLLCAMALCTKQEPMPAAHSVKKGYCEVTWENKPWWPDHDWRRALAALNVHWYYRWATGIPDKSPAGIEYVPIIQNCARTETEDSFNRVIEDASKTPGATALLGYNEPDCPPDYRTVEEALSTWVCFKKSTVPVGSPASPNATGPWMQEFMRGVEDRGLRVDFMAIHWYGPPDPQQLIDYVDEVYQLYHRPIWITEFAVADFEAKSPGSNRYSNHEVAEFMQAVIPKLERRSFVKRYCWFCAHPWDRWYCSSELFDGSGNLTEAGRLYASF